MQRTFVWLFFAAVFGFCQPAWAAHPLITDDTGTQGTGKYQVEVNGEAATDKESEAGITVEATAFGFGAALAAGVRDDLDIIVGIPFLMYEMAVGGTTVADEQGPGDVVVETKWRFLEQTGWSLAVRPGVTLPTGDEDKGLGTGETGIHLYLIATKEAGLLTLHGNVGYIRNENHVGGEKNLWHASAAVEYAAAESTRLVGNVGVEKNPDPAAAVHPAFALAGVIHSLREHVDIDGGIKFGLNNAEDDFTLLAGVAIRF